MKSLWGIVSQLSLSRKCFAAWYPIWWEITVYSEDTSAVTDSRTSSILSSEVFLIICIVSFRNAKVLLTKGCRNTSGDHQIDPTHNWSSRWMTQTFMNLRQVIINRNSRCKWHQELFFFFIYSFWFKAFLYYLVQTLSIHISGVFFLALSTKRLFNLSIQQHNTPSLIGGAIDEIFPITERFDTLIYIFLLDFFDFSLM